MVDSFVTTAPHFRNKGLGSYLFQNTQTIKHEFLQYYPEIGPELAVEVIDDSSSGWTTRRSRENGYIHLGVNQRGKNVFTLSNSTDS